MSPSSLIVRLRTVDRRLFAILALAVVLIFYRLSHVDMVGDDAHYSVRAIGLFDFMFGDEQFQSTPVQWFPVMPWWSYLSFHDHPIFLFVISHLFLSVSQTMLFAKLPFALMVLGTILLSFRLGKRLWDTETGLVTALTLTLTAHVIWAGRVSFLEGGVMFFTLLAILSFFRFVAAERTWWQWGLWFGLALSTKFTTLFLVPTFFLYLLWIKRDVFRRSAVYQALCVTSIVLFPIIFYNLGMYLDHGHFSLQFARLLHQPNPWHFSGVTDTGFLAAFLAMVNELGQLNSWPYFGIAIFSFFWAVMKNKTARFFGLAIFFLTIQQTLIGPSGYMLALFGPLLAPLIGFTIVSMYRLVRERYSRLAPIMRVTGIALAVYGLVFVVNSHLLIRHVGPVGWLSSKVTSDNFGMVQLDRYFDDFMRTDPSLLVYDIYGNFKARHALGRDFLPPYTLAERKQMTGNDIVVYDSNISWFARVWLMERRRLYDPHALISVSETEVLAQLQKRGVGHLYFVRATDAAPLDPVPYQTNRGEVMEAQIIKLGISPELIYRDDGQVAFKVYHVPPTPVKK